MRWFVIIICSFYLFACKVAAPVQLPDVKNVPDTFASGHPDTNSIANISWRQFFEDPYLVALIDTALRNNPDLFIANQRVEMAKAELMMRKAAFLPSLEGSIFANFDRFGDYTMTGVGNFDTNLSPNIKEEQKVERSLTPEYFVGLRSSWEVDIWGKLKNQKKAAAARLLATEQGRHLLVTNIVASVASMYYEMLALDKELSIVAKNVNLQQEALEVVKIQKEGGRATQLAVQQFTAQLLNTKAIHYTILQEIIAIENHLNSILGRYSQEILKDTSIMHQQLPAVLSTGNSSQLLIRRPDIREAELALMAAKADIDAIRAAFLPSLQLSPYVAFNSFKGGLLFDPGSFVYGIASGITAPIFAKRQLKGEYNIAAARGNEAFYNYQKTLLNSYNEVVTNIRNIENSTSLFNLKQEEVNELTAAVSTARELYLAGYANYLEVITAQKGVLEAELELMENKKRLFHAAIDLYRSLGGGWDE